MFIQSLESRRLMAAIPTAVLSDGTLTVTGNNSSDVISISVAAAIKSSSKTTTASDVTTSYVVSDNGKSLGSFLTKNVQHVRVFAEGGNDRIALPSGQSQILEIHQANNGLEGIGLGLATDFYVDGGSGRDRIDGSFGRDTIFGGSVNDVIHDAYGTNVIDGGAGNDSIDTVTRGASSTESIYFSASHSTVTAGSGQDALQYGAGDTLVDQFESAIEANEITGPANAG